MALVKDLEIENDAFYFKKDPDCEKCQFAYLHLAEDAHDIYLAYFKDREVKDPLEYWWEENDGTHNSDVRNRIIDFIGEAYLSLYIKKGLEKPVEKSLWRNTSCINCAIPSEWWNKVKNIKRKTL